MRSIVIADDHADIRHLLRVMLGQTYVLHEAEDGATALALVKLHQPDIVLLDVMMPGGMDGLQVLQAIKSDPATCTIKVAMVSARGQVADADAAQQLGASAYFVKPFSPLHVVEWVRKQLG